MSWSSASCTSLPRHVGAPSTSCQARSPVQKAKLVTACQPVGPQMTRQYFYTMHWKTMRMCVRAGLMICALRWVMARLVCSQCMSGHPQQICCTIVHHAGAA